VPTSTRRARQRDATLAEIKATARGLLVESGPEALTLRATARDMGMTAPALYRYVASHEDLVVAVCQDVLDEVTAALEVARDTVPVTDPVGRLMATCRAFREWALAHPREFQLTFASVAERPPPAHEVPGSDISFGAVFLGIFVEIWEQQPFPVPPAEALPPALVAQLDTFAAATASDLPTGALVAYLGGWVRLYGSVTLEVFGHLGFALSDAEALFEAMLADMRRQLAGDEQRTG
jgi:AcrR family transcriptional regulator